MQGYGNARLDDAVHHAERLAAQGKGILRTRRNQAATERRDDVVHLVRETHDESRTRLWLRIAREARHVVLVDRKSYVLALAVETRVLLAHDALQLRKLRDHSRHEIRLGKERCTHRRLLLGIIRTDGVSDFSCELFETQRLVVDRAKPFLEHDGLELFQMLRKALLPVLVEEELRVGEARAQHALVAVLHRLKVLFSAVSHREEERQELAVRRLHGEVALMVAHRRDDGVGRQSEILVLEASRERCRILDEVKHLFEEVRRDFRRAAMRFRRFDESLLNESLAPRGIDDDEGLLARLLVMRGILNREVACAEETMAARCIAALDTCKLEGHDPIAVERDEPAQGTDEAEVEIAPAHAVRKRKS